MQRWVASRPAFLAFSPEMLDDWVRRASRQPPLPPPGALKQQQQQGPAASPDADADPAAAAADGGSSTSLSRSASAADPSRPQQQQQLVEPELPEEYDIVVRQAKALSNLYKEMHASVKDDVAEAREVFAAPELVLDMFMQRLLEQNVQAALERLLLPSGGRAEMWLCVCTWGGFHEQNVHAALERLLLPSGLWAYGAGVLCDSKPCMVLASAAAERAGSTGTAAAAANLVLHMVCCLASRFVGHNWTPSCSCWSKTCRNGQLRSSCGSADVLAACMLPTTPLPASAAGPGMAALAASTNAISAATAAAPSTDRASNSANPTLTLRERAMGRASTLAASFSGAPTGSAGSGSAGGAAGSGGSASSGGVAASGGSFGGAGPAPAALQRQQLRLLAEAYSKTQRLALNLERVVRGVAQVRLVPLGSWLGKARCCVCACTYRIASMRQVLHGRCVAQRLISAHQNQQLVKNQADLASYLAGALQLRCAPTGLHCPGCDVFSICRAVTHCASQPSGFNQPAHASAFLWLWAG
jgi:hypothetical protein